MRAKPGLLLFYPYMEQMAGDAAGAFELVRAWEGDGPERAIDEKGDRVVAILTTGQDYSIDDALFDRLPHLRLVVAVGAGYTGINVPQARRRGIMVTNAGDTHSSDCAEHAIGLAFALNRRIIAHDRYVRDGSWATHGYPEQTRALSAERFGILGLGRIGRAVAERLTPFGAEIAWWGPNPKDVPWRRFETAHGLAEWSTMLIVTARGDSLGLVDAAMIDAVGPDGHIVNISRGGVIDEDALIEALCEGRLGGAGLDVFREEPATPERWRDVPNLVLSPHVAGQTVQAMARLQATAARNLRTVLDGSAVANELMS